MIEQIYDDWRRMLAACQLVNKADALRLEGNAVAEALGIDKRKRLEWKLHGSGAVEASEATVEIAGKMCNALSVKRLGAQDYAALVDYRNAMPPFDPRIHVTGHPTQAMAVEHLERLLGREGGSDGK